jgi:hypothetical protein
MTRTLVKRLEENRLAFDTRKYIGQDAEGKDHFRFPL